MSTETLERLHITDVIRTPLPAVPTITAMCCRTWVVAAVAPWGSCGICGERPTYIGPDPLQEPIMDQIADIIDARRGDPILVAANIDMPNEHYGVRISTVGEDGDIIALGHVEPRRFLAAAGALARTFLGITAREALGLEYEPAGSDHESHVSHGYALFWEHPDHGWWCKWGQEADTPNALPVTMWGA